ncbi:GntT/GntP/DsdX family permease [Staphylococcus aureus]
MLKCLKVQRCLQFYLAWIVAAVLRIALGSATVAAISTTGIVLVITIIGC